jgi:hypothetical protein
MRLLTVFLVIPIVVTLLLAPCGFAQSINLGLKMGARLTSEVKDSVLNQSFPESQQNSSITDASRLIAFGPTIQVQLPLRVSVETGALYRSVTTLTSIHVFENNSPPDNPFVFNLRVISRMHSKSIEAPTLLRFRFSDELLQPFLGAGYVYKRFLDPSVEVLGGPRLPLATPLTQRSNHGLGVSGGVELKTGFFRLSPELRYTRWSRRIYDVPGSPQATNLNQIDTFLGIGLLNLGQ